MHMHTQEGYGLGPHVLHYIELLLLEPEPPINASTPHALAVLTMMLLLRKM